MSLLEIFKKIHRNKQCDIYVCGDISIKILNQTSNATNEFVQCLYSLVMLPLINKPTCITNHSETLIYIIFSNVFGISHIIGILVSDISDRIPIFTIIEENIHISRDVPMDSQMKVRNNIKKYKKILYEQAAM